MTAATAALLLALTAKDGPTGAHSKRVAERAGETAFVLCPGDAYFARKVRLAGLLHDVGKIGVPDAVLTKPGRLTGEEFAAIRLHPLTGAAILEPLFPADPDLLAMVRGHHERWDGQGYPDGLAGEAIPLGARILAVADAYDAMTSDRSYQRGMPAEQAERLLSEGAGLQWDRAVVEAFLAQLRSSSA